MAYTAFLLLVDGCFSWGAIRSFFVAHAAEQPRMPSILRTNEGESDIDVDNPLGNSRRNRLQLHLEKQRRALLSKEDGDSDTPKPRDGAMAQEPHQSRVYDDMHASQHYRSVKGSRKKREEDEKVVAIKDEVVAGRVKDVTTEDGSSKDNDTETLLIDSESPELSSNIDQERGKDGSAPGSFEDINKDNKQHGGMTKKENYWPKKTRPHDEPNNEEQHAIARKNGWKEKDGAKRNLNTPDEEDEREDWSGCVCDKWKKDLRKHGGKAGRSKGFKSKESKSKRSKGRVIMKIE